MTITVDFFSTGTGITSTIGTYRWNGHSFNPTGNTGSGYQTWNPWTDSWAGYAISGSTSSFDLTDAQYGNEVVLAALKFTTSVNDSGTITFTWVDPDANTLVTYALAWSAPATNWYGAWAGIGVKELDGNHEIWKDGTYTVYYDITYGGGTVSGHVHFTISNYPSTREATAVVGSIWIEGEFIAYIPYQGWKILCSHDGSSSAIGAGYAGSLWLETNGKITYIDASGNKRNTKLGDKYGWGPGTGGYSNELPAAPGAGYAGTMWVSNDDMQDTFIMIISADGIMYRIGAGYATSGDYQ
jgi:hypothetical protein